MGHWQTVKNLIRCHRMQRLIRFLTVCLQNVLLKFRKKKITTQHPNNGNGFVLLLRVGKSIWLKWVNVIKYFSSLCEHLTMPYGKFSMICCLLILFKINLFEKFFQDYHLSVIQIGSRSGLIWAQTAKVINRRH